tara:strand:+ start:3675 stop:4031 length:357 start_codon:yes stop_codon:yes gene_type:complete
MAMTVITFDREQCPDIRRFQLDTTQGDGNKATQVNIPSYARQVTIRPNGKKVRMSFTTSSDDIHSDFIKLSADTPSEFTLFTGHKMGTQIDKIYIANKASTTGTFVEVLIEAGDRPEQ